MLPLVSSAVRPGFPVLTVLLFAAAHVRAGEPALAWKADGRDQATGRFEAGPLPADSPALRFPEKYLSVRVEAGPGLLGTWGAEGKTAWFRPRFPLAPGVRHTVRMDTANGSRPIVVEFTPPVPRAAPSMVVSAHPSGPSIPENTLRFYLVFSAPMRTGEAYRHVRIVRDDGHVADLPFLELDEELWDPSGTRLTLLIDPGRIKRGVKPLIDLGPVFEAGRKYSLRVDPAWQDANGNPLAAGHSQNYSVAPAVRERIDPASWEIFSPRSANDPLTVRFPRALDKALAERLIRVADLAQVPVAGSAEASAGETLWRFKPKAPWRPGHYHLAIDPALEDPAGNRPDRLFDAPGESAPNAGMNPFRRSFAIHPD